MRIKEVADHFKISTATLRYYERIGVLPKVKKDSKGYRIFTKTHIEYLEYVMALKAAGISLENIIEYVELSQLGENTVETRKELLIEERETIQMTLSALEKKLEVINKKIDNYYEFVLPKTGEIIKKITEDAN